MRYDTLLLDADNTLLDFDRAEREALERLFKRLCLPFSEQAAAVYHEINLRLWKAFEREELEKAAIGPTRFARLFERLGIDRDGAAANAVFMDYLGQGCYRMDGALEACRALRAMGCRLYIVTNGTARVQYSRMGGSGLAPYLDALFISEEVGLQKPLKGFFDDVAAHIPGFDRARTLMVGDSLTSDIAGGKAAGLDTCWFCPGGGESPEPTYTIRALGQLVPLARGELEKEMEKR